MCHTSYGLIQFLNMGNQDEKQLLPLPRKAHTAPTKLIVDFTL